MHLKHLYLRNFRSYAEAEVAFSPGLNLFYGENAQGKTNLLEAIYFISTGRSFRAEELQSLIREGSDFFFLEAKIEKDGIQHTVQASFDGASKKVMIDHNGYATFQHLIGLLPSVLYTPADADLVDGAPVLRRRFLNLHLAQRDPLYIHHLARYWRAMKQRNAQLKSKRLEGIESWESEMANSAAYIYLKRASLIEELEQPYSRMAHQLAGKEEIHRLRFHPSYPQAPEAFAAQLKRNRVREEHIGATLTGPHRDDFSLWIEEKNARLFASEGQKKTAVAALRMTEWESLTRSCGSRALLGIDDFGLHLDSERKSLLRDLLQTSGQTFVTVPQAPEQWHGAQVYRISAGQILT